MSGTPSSATPCAAFRSCSTTSFLSDTLVGACTFPTSRLLATHRLHVTLLVAVVALFDLVAVAVEPCLVVLCLDDYSLLNHLPLHRLRGEAYDDRASALAYRPAVLALLGVVSPSTCSSYQLSVVGFNCTEAPSSQFLPQNGVRSPSPSTFTPPLRNRCHHWGLQRNGRRPDGYASGSAAEWMTLQRRHSGMDRVVIFDMGRDLQSTNLP